MDNFPFFFFFFFGSSCSTCSFFSLLQLNTLHAVPHVFSPSLALKVRASKLCQCTPRCRVLALAESCVDVFSSHATGHLLVLVECFCALFLRPNYPLRLVCLLTIPPLCIVSLSPLVFLPRKFNWLIENRIHAFF